MGMCCPGVWHAPQAEAVAVDGHRRYARHPVNAVPTVTIHVPGPLRPYCGGQVELSISADTVRAVLAELERCQPRLYANVCDETGTVRRHLNVFINADHMRDRDGIDTALATGDVVTFLPAVSGG